DQRRGHRPAARGFPVQLQIAGTRMKKCSHSAHETLTELNITPLLDLAFVLLVIFIITTTPIVNDLDLSLPVASKRQKDPPRKANYITVEANGTLHLNKKH